ncbi:unnamed protein product [Thelazia callipaeda]|uniref:Uncharacterized protein n=1 Tax=Thelazia callipaeda TaxID=103827 RepID=A0A0N5CTQ2_THECL|nr:unnamed protein product [Thelazia callipaeda]
MTYLLISLIRDEVQDQNNFVYHDLGWDCKGLLQMLCEGEWYIRLRRGIHPVDSSQLGSKASPLTVDMDSTRTKRER